MTCVICQTMSHVPRQSPSSASPAITRLVAHTASRSERAMGMSAMLPDVGTKATIRPPASASARDADRLGELPLVPCCRGVCFHVGAVEARLLRNGSGCCDLGEDALPDATSCPAGVAIESSRRTLIRAARPASARWSWGYGRRPRSPVDDRPAACRVGSWGDAVPSPLRPRPTARTDHA